MPRAQVIRIDVDVCGWCSDDAVEEAFYPGSGDLPARVYGVCGKCAEWLRQRLAERGGYPARVEPKRGRPWSRSAVARSRSR